MAQFQLLAGIHVQHDKTKPILDEAGKPIPGKFEPQTVHTGEICESDTDLVAKHGASKFRLVGGTLRATPPAAVKSPVTPPEQPPVITPKASNADLDRLSLKDLQAYAEDNEIDLKGAKSRDDVLKIVKSAK